MNLQATHSLHPCSYEATYKCDRSTPNWYCPYCIHRWSVDLLGQNRNWCLLWSRISWTRPWWAGSGRSRVKTKRNVRFCARWSSHLRIWGTLYLNSLRIFCFCRTRHIKQWVPWYSNHTFFSTRSCSWRQWTWVSAHNPWKAVWLLSDLLSD